MSERITKAKRRYTLEMVASMALYLVVLFAALTMAKPLAPGPLLTGLALAPVAPLLLACFSFFRFYRHMDEMQKRVSADAAALTLVVAILSAITLGFLKRFGVMDIASDMIWFGPFLIVVWGAIRFWLGGRSC